MYIVKKKIKGKDYFYLRESRREGGKVIAKTLAYLGKTQKEAEKKFKEIFSEREKKIKDKSVPLTRPDKLPNKEKKETKLGDKLEEINSIAGRRGFFFQTAGIYGGRAGFFTYGHLGKLLKLNWERKSWLLYLWALRKTFEIELGKIMEGKYC